LRLASPHKRLERFGRDSPPRPAAQSGRNVDSNKLAEVDPPENLVRGDAKEAGDLGRCEHLAEWPYFPAWHYSIPSPVLLTQLASELFTLLTCVLTGRPSMSSPSLGYNNCAIDAGSAAGFSHLV